MDFVTVSTGLILPYWFGFPIRYIHIHAKRKGPGLFLVSILQGPFYFKQHFKFNTENDSINPVAFLHIYFDEV